MILEGSLDVVEAIKEKKRLMDRNQSHKHIKILCICDGGLLKGSYSIGVGLALDELGYTDVFSDIVGVSSGAVSVAYFLGGNARIGGSLIYEECCSSAFINLWKFWRPANNDFIIAALKGATGKPLDFKKIFSSSTKLHVGVSDFDSSRPVLITPTNEDELLSAIKASLSIPSLTPEKVFIEKKRYMDGGISFPHIIDEVVKKLDFTHVLYLASQNKNEKDISIFEKILHMTLYKSRFSRKGLSAVLARRHARDKGIDILKSQRDIKHLIVWGDGTINGIKHSGQKVKSVVYKYKDAWLKVMGE